MNLCDELTIRMLLERHGFHFSKSMGQNFLIDPQIPADIAAASQADETCGVLEIGPGIGPARWSPLNWTGRCCPFWQRPWPLILMWRSSPEM